MMWKCMLEAMTALIIYVGLTKASQYDPHVYPDNGPFFEGWYIRVLDFAQNETIGVLFGRVIPRDDVFTGQAANYPALVSILYRDGPTGSPLQSHNAFLRSDQIHESVNDGDPVTKNPDFTSPPDFTWRADDIGYLRVLNRSAQFQFTVNDWSFSAVIGAPVQWDTDGLGPEGWLAHLPLPLHWFVYSLRSPVVRYDLINRKTNESVSGRGVAHMEKNWGKSFPKAWIWVEGSTNSGVSLAISGGLVTFFNSSLLTVPAYLIGYRNPEKGLKVDFKPTNSIVTVTHNGCTGRISLVANSIWAKLEVHVTGPMSSFSDCLYGPDKSGFRKLCVESYDAVATVVYQDRFRWSVADRQVIHNTALEFGGDYVCGNHCKQEQP